MVASSEYMFPIFISSTDYGLRDLRAELALYLSDLGYKPILSSSEGFPDKTPAFEPWESCLHVLEKCFIMLLVIDHRYGRPLDWPNFPELFSGKKVSPTHGEYLFAHYKGIRMMVFIRKELSVYYQTFRSVHDKHKDRAEADKILASALPEGVSRQTLEFISQVKTTKPIPWIKEFDNVTEIKTEVKKRLLNEFAEYFMVKKGQMDAILAAFERVVGELPAEKQKKILAELGPTKALLAAESELAKKESELKSAREEMVEAKRENSIAFSQKESQIFQVNTEIDELRSKIENLSSKTQVTSWPIGINNVEFSQPLYSEPLKWGYRNFWDTNNSFLVRPKPLEEKAKDALDKVEAFLKRENVSGVTLRVEGDILLIWVDGFLSEVKRKVISDLCVDEESHFHFL